MEGNLREFGINLSVVIPAFNEASRISETVIDINQYLENQNFSYEIIVVNDGSSDNTSEIVNHLKEHIPALRLLDNPKNRGKGKVVRQGLLEANGCIRLFTDADNSTRINQIEKLSPYLEEGYHIVIGSRANKDANISVNQPWYRIIIGKLGNKLVQALAVPGIKDTQCGFKVFTHHAVRLIFPKMTIDGWGFDIEALAIARHLNLEIKEVGIEWTNHPESFFKPFDYFRVMQELCKICWNGLWKKYVNSR
ncbi:dolichyl-phosphate beta-glucosyltransferase [Acidobacteriota bacterium]